MTGSKNLDKTILPIVLLTFVNSMNLSILTPTLPFVIKNLGQNELMYGLLLSAYSIFQFLFAPVVGALSDRFGRRPILLVTQFGTVISWILFAISYFFYTEYIAIPLLTVWVLVVARVADGITGSNSCVASAYVADVTKPEDKLKNFGLIEVAMGVGLFFGLAIGSFTGNDIYGYLPTALVAIAISTVTLLIMFKFMPESLPPENRLQNKINLRDEANGLKKLFKYKSNKFLFAIFKCRALISFAMSFFISIIILHIVQVFSFSKTEIGYILLGVGVMMIINQTVLLKLFIDRLGNFWTLFVAQFLIGIGLLGMSLTSTFWLFIFAYLFANLGFSLSLPTTKTMISNNVSSIEQGEVLGVDMSVYALATAFTPMIASVVYFGFKQMGNTSMSFLVLSLLPFIGFLSLFLLQRGYTLEEIRIKSI